ncbi:class I SAM-dependent methyltransferase [Lentzea sp. DG1S-22]|uniref:class I SAM-dependent methyltransferase n=1 Tax=Lentzea sp. DG1S-22 TaxID=3108822 RepID=UPI002E79C930|nr:class I SAM-dependent methyltransferase [Lentzea sp. DG1S-22]WVH82067.1 class I SAM-dependent methyltransferase [Lentzea sp. DG1S-22]
MENYTPSSYGDTMAPVFDFLNVDEEENRKTVEFLSSEAAGQHVLEPCVGTGRIAIPLAQAGYSVHGIEVSAAMAEQLRGKPGGELVEVIVGDMMSTRPPLQYDLIYLLQNGLGNLLSEKEQVEYLRQTVGQLRPGGRLVLESWEPEPERFVDNQYVETSLLDANFVVLSAAQLDPGEQVISQQSIMISNQGIQLYPVRFRYFDVDQLDAMAAEAGLVLRDRYSDWDRAPYSEKGRSISVFVAA